MIVLANVGGHEKGHLGSQTGLVVYVLKGWMESKIGFLNKIVYTEDLGGAEEGFVEIRMLDDGIESFVDSCTSFQTEIVEV